MSRTSTPRKHAAPVARKQAESATAQSPTMILFVLMGVLGIIAYGTFLLNPANRGDLLPYVLVIVAESVLAFSALMSMWTILAGSQDPRDFSYNRAAERLFSARQIDQHQIGDDVVRWPLRLHGAE